jgi:predicted nucleotide-binding protein
MQLTFETIKHLVNVKNQGTNNLVAEQDGNKIQIYNNKTGINSEYNTLMEAYVDLYHNLC